MARMTAADAAVAIMQKEGVRNAFGVPGAAINPLYAALRRSGQIDHVLARHVEGASYCSMVPEAYDCTFDGRIVEVEDDRFCAKTYTVCVGKITSKRRINCHAENDCTPQGETCRAGSCVAPDRADAGDAAAPVL